ncbi:MAG: endolytic transglycosylase MltG [Bacteroidota bacterium]|nr:endolytic transglycosylase MltG [Bacteroidota bacterium]
MSKFKKFILKLFILAFVLFLVAAFGIYKLMFSPNITSANENTYLFVPTGSSFQNVVDLLEDDSLLKNKKTFMLTAKIKKYSGSVKAGKYKLDIDETNWHLINKLRSGNQKPLNIIVPSVRLVDDLSDKVSAKLEFSEDKFSNLIHDKDFLDSLGYDENTISTLFLPNTYEFYWNTSAKEFIKRMKKEHNKFWTTKRLEKAKKINLSPLEVSILASIVQSEQMQHRDERARIAGLYLNRLNKGIMLQSDPTVVFAIGDFSIKRVLDYMLKKKSPYNTYLYRGLPPGAILIPELQSIDAVLNAEKNDYIFMCAKEDFSGYHYFAIKLSDHIMYAKRYHNALNINNIR